MAEQQSAPRQVDEPRDQRTNFRPRTLIPRSQDIRSTADRTVDPYCFVDERAPWTDQPDFDDILERRLAQGQVSDHHAAVLQAWHRFGVVHLTGLVDFDLLDRLWEDFDRAWTEKLNVPTFHGPQGRHYALLNTLNRTSDPALRLFNFHHFSDAGLALLMHPAILAYMRLLLDRKPLGMQSLTYERSSEQYVHADYGPVRPEIPSHLIGCWIACEDIDPDAGPLIYYPGSHAIDHSSETGLEYEDFFGPEPEPTNQPRWLAATLRANLSRRVFVPKKGDVLLWHSKLLHGGGKMRRPELTRKSFVTHYTSYEAYPHCNFYRNVELRDMNGGHYFALVD